MVLLFRRRACSLSPVHVQISCDSFLSDKSTCSRTRRKPSFPNVPEITANINRRDVDDSQRRVLTTRRDLANETFRRRQILFDRKAGALAFGHRICLLNIYGNLSSKSVTEDVLVWYGFTCWILCLANQTTSRKSSKPIRSQNKYMQNTLNMEKLVRAGDVPIVSTSGVLRSNSADRENVEYYWQ